MIWTWAEIGWSPSTFTIGACGVCASSVGAIPASASTAMRTFKDVRMVLSPPAEDDHLLPRHPADGPDPLERLSRSFLLHLRLGHGVHRLDRDLGIAAAEFDEHD